jgi:hypothetical protein
MAVDTVCKPANSVRWRGSVARRDEARPFLVSPGDVVLVERGCPRSLVIKCPCGCGEELVINLDGRVGPAWRLYRDKRGLTLFPSVWRESGCRSHFIVWHDTVFMCNADWVTEELADQQFEGRVLSELPTDRCRSFDEVANAMNEIPWSVLTTCRALVRRGLVREGTGKLQGCFQRCSQ